MSYDGVLWAYTGDVSIAYDAAAATAGTYRIETPITDQTKMGRFIRFLFLFKSSDGTATYATVSALVATTFVGQ